MAVGQVSFHNDKKVKRGTYIFLSIPFFPPSSVSTATLNSAKRGEEVLIPVHVQTRDNAIVNRLNKTKVEKEVDHESDRQERLRLEGRKKKVAVLERVRSLHLTSLPRFLSRTPSTSFAHLLSFNAISIITTLRIARELIL
jgi:hypothetical protein